MIMPPSTDASPFKKFIMAGQKMMYDPKTRDYFIADLKKQADPTDTLSMAVVGIIKMLDDRMKGAMPREAIAPVATALLIEASHFAASAGFFVMTKKAIDVARQKMIAVLTKLYGKGGGPTTPPAATAPGAAPAQGLLNQQPQGV